MKFKKFFASALASMLALGTFTALPEAYAEKAGVAITVEAAESDFVIKTDNDGYKYIASYKGKGGDITLPKVDYVDEEVFKGNKTITSVTVSDGIIIGPSAFKDCHNLKKVIFEGNTCIYDEAFKSCINLKTVEINGSITSYMGSHIGYNAFGYCYSLEKVSIAKNDSEFEIGPGAFAFCYSLKSINIPSKCTKIYQQAFLNCVNLEKISVPSNAKFVTGADVMCQMGYFDGAKTYDDAWDGKFYVGVADGKTSVYSEYFSTNGSGILMKDGTYFDFKKYTPKKLTMTVTKGSDAEKYAKENGIAYKYASSSSSSSSSSQKLAAPEKIKASKTSDSVTLSWSKVDGADAYSVYKYNPQTKKYEKYKTVKSTKCTISGLKKNTKYQFKIVALDKVDGKYKKGNTSKAISVTTKSK